MESNSITEADVWAYLTKTADAEAQSRVEAWIHSPHYDPHLYEELKNLSISKEVDYQQVDVSIARDRFFKSVQPQSTPFKWRGLVKYAAMLAVALSVTIYFYSSPKTSEEVLIQTGYGELVKQNLPDGSIVWLNAATRINYSPESPRQIYLDGEAFFEVAKDKHVPFVVTTKDDIHVTALGTSFNVRAYGNDPYVETVLVTGKVILTSDFDFKKEYEMKPNDKVTFNRSDKRVVRTEAKQIDDLIAWRTGVMQFTNTTFKQIALDLKNRFNANITIENKELEYARFTGSFESGTPIDEILETLSLIEDFEVVKLSDNEWLLK